MLITRRMGVPIEAGRFATIDGLRGYLAMLVFFSHGCLWYFYLRTGRWVIPPSRLYTHMGQSSVALFFMITGFLFFSKLIDARKKHIDWTRLFVSRFLRLGPLYLFAVLAVLLIVAHLSNGKLNEPHIFLLKHIVEWLAFSVVGSPNINGIGNSSTIMAGVTWSLSYEWFFYLSLPVLALCVRVAPPVQYILLGLCSVFAFSFLHPNLYHLLAFGGGIAAAVLSRWEKICELASRGITSLVVLGSIGVAVACYPTAAETAPLFLLSVAFIIIACGNSLFGFLTHPVSRTLGQMAYSIYLLHGIVLFVTFNFVLGLQISRQLSPLKHWLLVMAATPILVVLCDATFRLIEQPAMRSTNDVIAWLRSGLPVRLFGYPASRKPVDT